MVVNTIGSFYSLYEMMESPCKWRIKSINYLRYVIFLISMFISCHSTVFQFPEHEFGDGENWIRQKRQVYAIEDEEQQDRAVEKAVDEVKLEPEQQIVNFTQTTTEYEFIIEITNEYYCERFGKLHVLCAYKDMKSGIVYYDRGVNTTEADFILRFIVRLRKRILMGKETGGNPGPLPKAYKLRVMKWSDELQVFAQRIANQAKSTINGSIIYATDNMPRLTISIAMSRDTTERPRWTQALRHWYEEIKNVKSDVIYHKNENMDHYTAMVWGSTGFVGCGYSCVKGLNPGMRVKTYVCVFGPGGNIDSKKIYATESSDVEVGKPVTTTTRTTAPIVKPTSLQNPFKKMVWKEEWVLG